MKREKHTKSQVVEISHHLGFDLADDGTGSRSSSTRRAKALRRGYWADAFEAEPWGSLLWLLANSPIRPRYRVAGPREVDDLFARRDHRVATATERTMDSLMSLVERAADLANHGQSVSLVSPP
jgi:hypothetical protein